MIKVNKNLISMVKKHKRIIFPLFTISLFVFFMFSTSMRIDLTENSNSSSSTDNSKSPIPASGYNVQLFLYEGWADPINQTYTRIGENFTLRGYVERFNSTLSDWELTNDIEVYPIIDGNNYDGNLGFANSTVYSTNNGTHDGQFEIDIFVPLDYDYFVNMTVLANVTQRPVSVPIIIVNENTVQSAPVAHDITTQTFIEVSSNMDSLAVLPNDIIEAEYSIVDANGQPLPVGVTNGRINLYKNNSITWVNQTGLSTIGATGIGFFDLDFGLEGWTHYGFRFLPTGEKTVGSETYYEYEGSFDSVIINRVEKAQVVNSTLKIINSFNTSADISDKGNLGSYSQVLYPSEDVIIMGQFSLNESQALSPLLAGKTIHFFFNATPPAFGQALINSTGGFEFSFNLEEDMGFTETNITFEINIVIEDYDSQLTTLSNMVSNITLEIKDPYPTPLSPDPGPPDEPMPDPDNIIGNEETNWATLLIPIGIIVGVIVGLVIFQRKRMELMSKREALLRAVDKTGKMGIIMSLCDVGKWREAIAYTYHIYTNLIYEKYAIKRSKAQTLREFAIICVNRYGQDPLRIYPFVSLVESVIYGNALVDRNTFNRAMDLFGKIFQDITGSIMGYALSYDEDNKLKDIQIDISQPTPPSKN